MLTTLPPNPVNGKNNVRIAEVYSVEDIVRLYREQQNVDVERYFEHGPTVYLLECPDIGYRFYYPFETAGGAEFYQDLDRAGRERGTSYDRVVYDDHRLSLAQIAPGDHVLEIGCNTGTFLEKVSKITTNVLGLDFNPTAIEKARSRGVTALNEPIEDYADKHPGEYDIVCAFQIFEHLARIGAMLTAMLKVLKPGGRLIMSVPNNEPFFQRFNKYDTLNMPPHHAGLWNLAAFKKLADEFDMIVVQHEYFGEQGLLADAYLRAKLMADVRSLPTNHSTFDKIKMLAVGTVALPMSTLDFLFRGVKNYANLWIVFQKR